jgi:hypothetical protein
MENSDNCKMVKAGKKFIYFLIQKERKKVKRYVKLISA